MTIRYVEDDIDVHHVARYDFLLKDKDMQFIKQLKKITSLTILNWFTQSTNRFFGRDPFDEGHSIDGIGIALRSGKP